MNQIIPGLLPLFIGICLSSAPTVQAQQPKLVCEAPSYDFGELPSTNTVEHGFVVWNKGDGNLEITKTRACCGASASLASKTIVQGTNTTYAIRMSLAGRSGKMNKSFYLHTNDPGSAVVQLKLSGTVIPVPGTMPTNLVSASGQMPHGTHPPKVIVIDPPLFHLGQLAEGSCVTGTVTVTAGTSQKIRVLDAIAGNACLKAVVHEIEAGKEYDVMVTTVPPLPPGRLDERVTVVTKGYSIQRLDVPVFGTVAKEERKEGNHGLH